MDTLHGPTLRFDDAVVLSIDGDAHFVCEVRRLFSA
jgi:hypothetical protein